MLIAVVAAVTGIKARGTRPVAGTRLMGVARVVLLVIVAIVAYAAPAPRDLLMGSRTGTVASLLQHHGSFQTWMKHKPGAFAKKWSKRFSDQQHALIPLP